MLQYVVDFLHTQHACHTVILYGSRARGDATPESDYDALGVRDDGDKVRAAFEHAGAYIDLFVYPKVQLEQVDNFLHVRGGRILVQQGDLATRLLSAVEARYQQGPEPMAKDEAVARRVWWGKMVQRARKGDLEGDYRRVWLLTSLLEDVCLLRGWWYRGPKESFRCLEEQDPPLCAAFKTALAPQATLDDVATLVDAAWEATGGKPT
jgi:predicted nucleotidyltransferase